MFFSKMGTDSGLMSALPVSKLTPRRTMTSSFMGLGAGAPTEYQRWHFSPERRAALQASGEDFSFNSYQRAHFLAWRTSAGQAPGLEASGAMSGIGSAEYPRREATSDAPIAMMATARRVCFCIRFPLLVKFDDES